MVLDHMKRRLNMENFPHSLRSRISGYVDGMKKLRCQDLYLRKAEQDVDIALPVPTKKKKLSAISMQQ
ncbi:hypothetical protein ANN_06537 [Periplaneta americana]|uniref:Uncharacterized protein n=1 Tax=Periplaneta americana TaxID=6978 RepID=A0ABQ8TFV1_PERAM|nr:hypothetical protein ANN_06537 [Periplaneta americana]